MKKLINPYGRVNTTILQAAKPRGYVVWELTEEQTGKVQKRGKSNLITSYARGQLAQQLAGVSITLPGFVGVGTGTTTPQVSDTDIETVSQYNGSNDAKAVDSKSVRGQYTTRLITQFTTAEANISITELGLLDAADAGNLWARVLVTITKTNTQRLTIYWYITFDRSENVAIKNGSSITATGTMTAGSLFTATFANTVTSVIITNNNGGDMWFRFNAALDGGTPPVSYDVMIKDTEMLLLIEEEFAISTISCFRASGGATGALPKNELSIVGW